MHFSIVYMNEKVQLESKNINEEKINQLKKLFPEIVQEGDKIDFSILRSILGDSISDEKFGITWKGKSDCYRVIQNTTDATLRPCIEESINFDDTQNVFIEGENLEVLKILQKSYSGKVKMIYIDPPYNTGKDFIYSDDYKDNLGTYLKYTNQKDERGKILSTNTESNGRYHSNWLSMMYPRLYLAKSLLKDDGVIFISIDDHEQHRLRMICDEIFGEENFVAQFVWNGKTGGADDKYIRNTHEYLLFYARNKVEFAVGERLKENEKFPKFDVAKQLYYKTQLARKWGTNSKRKNRPNLFYSIQAPDNSDVFPMLSSEEEGCWRWSKNRMLQEIKNGNIEFIMNGNNEWIVYEKIYKPQDDNHNTKKYSSLLDYGSSTAQGSTELKDLMNQKVFEFPKPYKLLNVLLSIANASDEDLILDFFSGSSTTAHAVMKLNAEDGGNRKYINVQLPEVCNEESEAYKAGYKTIADIGKERIRRAAKKIKEEYPNYNGDFGFKVFKLDSSNIVKYEGEKINNQEDFNEYLSRSVDNIKKDRSDEDILYQIILWLGISLTEKIEVKIFGDKRVFSINSFSSQDNSIDLNNSDEIKHKTNTTFVCLERLITQNLIDEIQKQSPDKVVFLDIVFSRDNDAFKVNTADNFKNNICNDKNKPIDFITI